MVYYLVTIHAQKKSLKVTHQIIQTILEWLKMFKVKVHDYVLSDHGQYRQLHYHSIVEYAGRYKNLTSKVIDNDYYQINWKPLNAKFGIDDACHYLDRNEKPIGMKWEEKILKESQERYMFI